MIPGTMVQVIDLDFDTASEASLFSGLSEAFASLRQARQGVNRDDAEWGKTKKKRMYNVMGLKEKNKIAIMGIALLQQVQVWPTNPIPYPGWYIRQKSKRQFEADMSTMRRYFRDEAVWFSLWVYAHVHRS